MRHQHALPAGRHRVVHGREVQPTQATGLRKLAVIYRLDQRGHRNRIEPRGIKYRPIGLMTEHRAMKILTRSSC